MLIYGTKTVSTVIKTGEFQCPNCQSKRTFTLKRFKKYFHIFYIPLLPIDNLGDSLTCNDCQKSYIPGAILSKEDYSPENPWGNNVIGNNLRVPPAQFGLRFGAYIIDSLLVYLLTIALALLNNGIFLFALGFIYFLACDIMLKGSSVGKLIFKIKISELEKDKLPTIINLILRNLIKGVCSFFPPIYLFALSNENAQTLHDKAAKTIVTGKGSYK